MSFFFFARWRKEREKVDMVVGLLPFRSLVAQNISLRDKLVVNH